MPVPITVKNAPTATVEIAILNVKVRIGNACTTYSNTQTGTLELVKKVVLWEQEKFTIFGKIEAAKTRKYGERG